MQSTVIEDGIFLSGSDGEKLPRLQRQVAVQRYYYHLTLQLPMLFKFSRFLFSNILYISNIRNIQKICTIRKFPAIQYPQHLSRLRNTGLEEALHVTQDTEAKARIQGVAALMRKFTFMFGSILGELAIKHTDNLSRTLQHISISAHEGQQVTSMTVATLNSIRSDKQ